MVKIAEQLSFAPLSNDCGALFSPCRKYRYTLWRIWDPGKQYACFLGLNPSTADETTDDPTVRRCVDYSRRWDMGGLYMLNIFAYRLTDPENMKAVTDPVGPDNDRWLNEIASSAGIVIAAWGNHGDHMDRGREVLAMLSNVYCLKLNSNGQPAHPLYLRKSLEPICLK